MDLVSRRAVNLGRIAQHGGSRYRVRCSCGHLNLFYEWSWAGHGKLRCKGCENFITRDLEVVPPGLPKVWDCACGWKGSTRRRPTFNAVNGRHYCPKCKKHDGIKLREVSGVPTQS